jgi:outer membrane protein assembly factor BamD (BamD/ComL family)
LIGAWYKNTDYTTAIKVGQTLIKSKPDYRPVLKIVGFSAYMVHQYNLAQLYLSQYKKLEPKDPEVDFILGLILFDK